MTDMEPKLRCALCKEKAEEGYSVDPGDNKEWKETEQIFGEDVGKWFICEPCALGLCQKPAEWWDEIRKRFDLK